MSLSLKRVEVTGVEPITLPEMKNALKVDYTNDDDYITGLIQAARERAESLTGRCLTVSKWRYSLDAFPWLYSPSNIQAPSRVTYSTWVNSFNRSQAISLPRAPIASVESIQYLADGSNATSYTTLDPTRYIIDAGSEPAILYPAYNSYWPIALAVSNAVVIDYTAGYDQDQVPEAIKVAMRVMVAGWYEEREDSVDVPRKAMSILSPYRTSLCGIAG